MIIDTIIQSMLNSVYCTLYGKQVEIRPPPYKLMSHHLFRTQSVYSYKMSDVSESVVEAMDTTGDSSDDVKDTNNDGEQHPALREKRKPNINNIIDIMYM